MNSKYWFLTIENNVKLSYSNGSIAFYLGFESSPSQKKITNVWAGRETGPTEISSLQVQNFGQMRFDRF